MKVETQDLQDRQVQLTVEVPSERLLGAMHRAARQLGSKTRIPGFRPGKAPYEILLGRFGEEAVFEEALEGLGQEVYREALESAAVEPFSPGSLDEVVSRDPLILRYTVPLPPEVDLGDYRSLRLPYQAPEVTDEALESFLEELRQGQALIEPAARPARAGDVVVADLHGELPADEQTEARPLVDQKGLSLLATPETDYPVPGVFSHLDGLEAGQTRSFEHLFPDDYPAEDLRGKTARFTLACQEVKSRTLPEWSDALAQSLGEFDDLLDLRVKARQGLEQQARRQTDSEYAEAVMAAVVERARTSFPPQLLREEVDDMLRELESRLRAQKISLPDYLKVQGKSEAELRAELEPRARERLLRGLVLSQVVETEKLAVTDEDVKAEIERLADGAGASADSVRKVLDHPSGRRRVAVDLLTEQALQRLVAIARGEAPDPAPADEPSADA